MGVGLLGSGTCGGILRIYGLWGLRQANIDLLALESSRKIVSDLVQTAAALLNYEKLEQDRGRSPRNSIW